MKLVTTLLAILPAIAMAQESHASAVSSCVAHEDHWDCPSGVSEPTTPPTALAVSATRTSSHTMSHTASGACVAHEDHWDCPSGVPEPTTPPSENHTDEHEDDHEHTGVATACEAHGDHWHCPSGIAEPTTPPAVVMTTGASTTAASASQSTGAAVHQHGSVPAGAVGIAVGLLGIFGI